VVATVARGSELFGVTGDGQRLLVGVPKTPPAADPGIRVIVGGIASLAGPPGASNGRRAK
jgi:hypothetical protein